MAIDLTFGNDEFESVRKAIDIDFTVNEIPDTVIQLPIYETRAKSEIEKAVKSLDDQVQNDNLDNLKIAASLLAASKLCTRIKHVISETISEENQRYQNRDFAQHALDLEQQAFEIVSSIIDEAGGDTIDQTVVPSLFLTVKPAPK